MKRLALIAAVAAVIGAWPAASSAAPRTGAVVAKHRSVLVVRRAVIARFHGVVLHHAAAPALGAPNQLQVSAVVTAVAPGMVTLTVGAQTFTLSLPAGLTLPATLVGQTVTLAVPLDDRNVANDDEDNDDHGDHGGGHSGHGGGDG